MHRGLPLEGSIESVDLGSSESEFGASINSTTSVGALEKSSSGSLMNSYVPSTNEVVSICNAIFEKLGYVRGLPSR